MRGVIAATREAASAVVIQHTCGHTVRYHPTPVALLSRRWEDVTSEACPACKSMADLNAEIIGTWQRPSPIGDIVALEAGGE